MVHAGKDLCVCVFLPLFLPFRSSVASGQTLIHPDSSAHLPALVWQPANSLIKVPGALLVQLVACKLINRFPVFNSFWECSALLWVVNQAFRAGFFFEKRHGRNSFKCFTVLGSWGRRIPWALQVLLVPSMRAILGFCFISLGCSHPVKYPLSMQRAARWSLHFAELSIRNQMCSGPSDWKHTEERDLLTVLRFVLEPWAGAARMFSLAVFSFRLLGLSFNCLVSS